MSWWTDKMTEIEDGVLKPWLHLPVKEKKKKKKADSPAGGGRIRVIGSRWRSGFTANGLPRGDAPGRRRRI